MRLCVRFMIGTTPLHIIGGYLGRSSEKIKFGQAYLRCTGAISQVSDYLLY